MKVYATFTDDIFEDDYEGWHYTRFDTIWSSLEKAQKRIKVMADDYIEKDTNRCCNYCSDKESCSGFIGCVVDSIDDADPNKIIINVSDSIKMVFYIQERRLDTLLGEGEG